MGSDSVGSRFKPIQPAEIAWRDNTPYCNTFDDVYFSRSGGKEEAQYIFLRGNHLPERFAERRCITVGETGFGTGLNFLTTLAEWRKSALPDGCLHYISVEKHPLTRTDLEQAVACWPELTTEARALLEVYPPLVQGLHRRQLFEGRVTLTLLFGDASNCLTSLNAQVDAWYLDGFAPSRNPAMWSAELFQQIARLSVLGGSFATFTAAGAVRRHLENAGFSVEKRRGFGRKRDMLCGHYQSPQQNSLPNPWFQIPEITPPATRSAVVIGGGLAGITSAHALAQRGWHVALIERHPGLAQEASGNPAGVLMPRLTADMNPDGQFFLTAYLHSLAWLNHLQKRIPIFSWQQQGVLQLMEQSQQARLAQLGLPDSVLSGVDQKTATKLAGTRVSSGGIHFTQAGWLSPPALCASLLEDQQSRISVIAGKQVDTIKHEAGQWQAWNDKQCIATAAVVILANGHDAMQFEKRAQFSLQRVRGQLTYLKPEKGQSLNMPVCYDGYIIPEYAGQHCVGATYDWQSDELELRQTDTAQNLAALEKQLPAFAGAAAAGGRVAFRTSSPDHLPIIGPAPDVEFYREAYADLRHGRPARLYPMARYRQGLFITSGHGSRGLITCPIAAELIAACLNQEPLPLSMDLVNRVHPARFLVRKLKQGTACL